MNLTAANQLTITADAAGPGVRDPAALRLPRLGAVTFFTAAVTDLLDGLIARRTGQKTTLGAWLDPMADKLLLVTMFVMLTLPDIGSVNRLPLWFTVLVISRDVVIVLTVAVVNLAVGPRTFRPSIFGKIATGDLRDDRRRGALLQLPRAPGGAGHAVRLRVAGDVGDFSRSLRGAGGQAGALSPKALASGSGLHGSLTGRPQRAAAEADFAEPNRA